MFKIFNLKDCKDFLSIDEFSRLVKEIYSIIDLVCQDYPNHKEWFFSKQLSGVMTGERNILFIKDLNEIIALACLKKTISEKKICTLYVAEKYRNLGIGDLILEESMKWLETRKPLITLSEDKLLMFDYFIDKYSWELVEVVPDLYKKNVQELCFNGCIIKDKTNLLDVECSNKIARKLNNKK